MMSSGVAILTSAISQNPCPLRYFVEHHPGIRSRDSPEPFRREMKDAIAYGQNVMAARSLAVLTKQKTPVQETYLRAWRSFSNFEASGSDERGFPFAPGFTGSPPTPASTPSKAASTSNGICPTNSDRQARRSWRVDLALECALARAPSGFIY